MTVMDLKKTTTSKIVVPALLALLLAATGGCSEEPQAVDEREEAYARAWAHAYLTDPAPTPTPHPPEPPDHVVLLIRPSEIEYTRFHGWDRVQAALGYRSNGELDIEVVDIVGADESSDIFAADRIEIDSSRFEGVIVTHTPGPILLNKIHAFVHSGGNAAVLINTCLPEDLEALFGITCISMPDRGPRFTKEGPGELFAPFWEEIYISGGGYGVQLLPGRSDFTCTPLTHPETGDFCTSLHGTVGDGNIIFMVSQWAQIGVPDNAHYAYAGSLLADYMIDNGPRWMSGSPNPGHSEAARRLLEWLVWE